MSNSGNVCFPSPSASSSSAAVNRQMTRFKPRRVLAVVIAILIPVFPLSSVKATEVGSPVRYWLTESGDGVIEITRCENALCGQIVGIDRAAEAPIPTDVHGRPECGLTIIEHEVPTSRGLWTGSITDPRDGTTYGADLWLDNADRLHVRGYLGIPLFGQTQTWTRYAGQLSDGCHFG